MGSFSRRARHRNRVARQQTLEIDKEWTDRVDMLGRKIIVAAADWQSLLVETASALGMDQSSAASELVEIYLESTDCNGHCQGFMAWLAERINEGAPEEAPVVHQTDVTDNLGRPVERPFLSVVVEHPKSSLAPSGAKVPVRLSLTEDPERDRLYFPVRIDVEEEDGPEVASRELVHLTCEWLCETWGLHKNALDLLRENKDHIWPDANDTPKGSAS